MTVATLVEYLCFGRDAIYRIAECKQAIWLGLLLVLSAGFAREYDGEDLLHEPWHVLIPVGASLVTSWLLFTLVYLAARMHQMPSGSYWKLYRVFLSLYWLTAPLAWLYAIPVERFLSAGDATRANLWLLGIVSVWRVALMMRVVHVFFRAPVGTAFALVMFFADTVALVVLSLIPVPVISVMGGVRLSESEQLIQSVSFLVRIFGGLSWLLWLIWITYIFVEGSAWGLKIVLPDRAQSCSRSAWILAACALLVWVPILPLTQPEQQLRYQAERLLYAGQVKEALQFMSQHEREEFPPHWDVPPRVAYHEMNPPLMDVLEQFKNTSVQPWVRELYQQKFQDELPYSLNGFLVDDVEEIERRISAIENSPNKLELIEPLRYDLQMISEFDDMPEELKQRINDLRALIPDEPGHLDREESEDQQPEEKLDREIESSD